MYYSSGNYEAFAHPEKPKDADKKSAYIVQKMWIRSLLTLLAQGWPG